MKLSRRKFIKIASGIFIPTPALLAQYWVPTPPSNPGPTGIEIINGLVLGYPFNGNTNDNSGNGYNGTATGSPGYVSGVPGSPISTQAISLNGSTQYVTSQSTTAFGSSSSATFTAWVYSLGNQSVYSSIVESRAGSNGAAGLCVSGSGTTNTLTGLWTNTASEYNATTGLVILNNAWNFVAGVVSASGVTVYLGASSTLISETITSQTLTGAWSIGNDSAVGSRLWNGYIEDVRVYNRNLSSTEISRIFNFTG